MNKKFEIRENKQCKYVICHTRDESELEQWISESGMATPDLMLRNDDFAVAVFGVKEDSLLLTFDSVTCRLKLGFNYDIYGSTAYFDICEPIYKNGVLELDPKFNRERAETEMRLFFKDNGRTSPATLTTMLSSAICNNHVDATPKVRGTVVSNRRNYHIDKLNCTIAVYDVDEDTAPYILERFSYELVLCLDSLKPIIVVRNNRCAIRLLADGIGKPKHTCVEALAMELNK